MATAKVSDFLRRLTRGMAAQTLGEHSDQQLVERALAGADEAAIQAIIQRHGSMVFRVCWRVLQHSQDAEDAFQATFLVLAQKLRMVRKQSSLASWLHGVAHRVALKAKAQSATRRCHERQATRPEDMPGDDVSWGEVRSALDVELNQLPDKWRLPLILCYLEGRTQDESARQLGWSKSTLRRRLEEARSALVCRLGRRGIVWSAALSAVLLSDGLVSAGPGSGLVAKAVEATTGILAGKTVAAVAAPEVALLAEAVSQAMLLTKLKTAMTVLLALVLGFGGGITYYAATGRQVQSEQVVEATGKPGEVQRKEEHVRVRPAPPQPDDSRVLQRPADVVPLKKPAAAKENVVPPAKVVQVPEVPKQQPANARPPWQGKMAFARFGQGPPQGDAPFRFAAPAGKANDRRPQLFDFGPQRPQERVAPWMNRGVPPDPADKQNSG